MKRFITIVLFLMFAFSAFGQGTQWFKGSFEEAEVKAREDGKLIVVFFYSPM